MVGYFSIHKASHSKVSVYVCMITHYSAMHTDQDCILKKLVQKQMSIFNLRRFACNIRRFILSFLHYNFAYFCSIVPIAYKVHNFHIKTIKHSCLLGDKFKLNANVSDEDHKITNMHHFTYTHTQRYTHT